MNKNYLNRLSEKLKLKKFESNQPIKTWIFVFILNLVGLTGFYFLKIYHISPSS